MGFFEELERKARRRRHFMQEYGEGVGGTIEALKEMMAEGPIRGNLYHHRTSWAEPWSAIILPQGVGEFSISGHHGTDGEEVYVIVVRKEQDE